MVQHLLSVVDVQNSIQDILNTTENLKKQFKAGSLPQKLRGKTLALIFEKPSTRTRISFETAMAQLGGNSIYLDTADLQIARGETIADTARVISRYVDIIVYRAYNHENVVKLATHSQVPVINGLDNLEHPCQIISDLFTIKEHKGRLNGIKLAYVGDGNNVCNSLLLGAVITGMDINVACPVAYQPNRKILETAYKICSTTGSKINIYENASDAVKGMDIIYTDVWVSMGDEKNAEERHKVFAPYQVNEKLVSLAKQDCMVMHCLPAHRGYEITDSVIDGKQSIVFEQAENRLHTQKAILLHLLQK
jgi:ornithine carbamoyltransferase